MNHNIEDSLDYLPGLGKAAVNDFKKIGISKIEDLLFYFPFRYEDHSVVKKIADLKIGEQATLQCRIKKIKNRHSFRRRNMLITEAVVEDETGKIGAIWFNQPYIAQTLKEGEMVSLAGKVSDKYNNALVSPVYEKIRGGELVHTGRIVPIYPLTGTLTQKRIRAALFGALQTSDMLVEFLPKETIESDDLMSRSIAIKAIHFPDSTGVMEKAVDRFKFEELFLHQIMFALSRKKMKQLSGHKIEPDAPVRAKFIESMPFALTNAQTKAMDEISIDLRSGKPMNRLLQGDVGSGKTVVAAFAINCVAPSGQSVYIAPTEILAVQQQKTLQNIFPGRDVALFTHSYSKIGARDVARVEIEKRANSGDLPIIVSTHAMLQEKFKLPKLKLLVVDEQHRFGVRQRQILIDRHTVLGFAPHLLSMSATPIPRSLALSIYGDLDLSILDELPAGRKIIATSLVNTKESEAKMLEQIISEIKNKHQIYVVCPLIDPSDTLGVQSVSSAVEEMKKGALSEFRIDALHGRLKSDRKKEILEAFTAGEIDILVSTTVVEVGVNVPNATVMVIEGAERFGLAQLHQLRGRVGRCDLPSYCFLKATENTYQSRARLMAMVKCHDGFALAEKDLQFRGPGNIFGNAQSGFPDFKLATVADTPIMKRAHDAARHLLEVDPKLSLHKELLIQLKHQLSEVHFE